MHGDDFNREWKSIRSAAKVALDGIMELIPASQRQGAGVRIKRRKRSR